MTNDPRMVDRLVLSAKPLPSEGRRRFIGEIEETRFADLAELSRGRKSMGAVWRSLSAKEVVVTGTETELHVFGDILCALARLVPAESRWLDRADQRPRSHLRPLPILLARLGMSTARSFVSLGANAWNCRRILAEMRRPPERKALERCLYLRPTLVFGEQVGGSIGHVAGVANALSRRGQKVKLVSMSHQPLLDPNISQVIVEPTFRSAFPNDLNRHRYHRIFLREALRTASHFSPSYLYVRYSLSDVTGPVLRRKLGIPLILEYNGSEVWAQRHWGQRLLFESISALMEEANVRAADLVVVVSEEVRRQVLSLGIPEERVLFYPNCVDPNVFDPLKFDAGSRAAVRRRLEISSDALLFTFVGTFGRWHGTEVLAEAIRELVHAHRTWLESRKIHFLFVGDGPLAPKVRANLGPECQGPFVTLAGYRPQSETASILAASDVLLSPHVPNPDGSPFFGSPTKLFEYMAMGKPIVASDLDQIGQVLRGWRPDHGEPTLEKPAAVLVKPGDVKDLVRGILLVEGMEAGPLQELGRRARAFVLRSFTWDRNVDAVLARLGQLLGGPGIPGRPFPIEKAGS